MSIRVVLSGRRLLWRRGVTVRRRTLRSLHGVVLLGMGLAACWSEPTGMPEPRDPTGSARALEAARQEGLLNEIRVATAHYRQVETALRDGYDVITPCLYSSAGYGARGHLHRKTALLDEFLDPMHPEILMYEPKPDGTRELVGVHYVVLAGPWDALHPRRVPQLGSEMLRDRRAPGAAPFSSYSLFVALWRENPTGIYEDFNPAVSCAHAVAALGQ